MRCLSLRVARWHRHVSSHKPSYSASSGLFTRPLPRQFSSRPILYDKDRDLKVSVRHFEQTTIDSKDRVEVDPEAEVREEQDFLKSKIRQLEQELEELREGPFGPNSPFMKQLPKEDREKTLESLRRYDAEHGKPEEDELRDDELLDPELENFMKDEFEGILKQEKELWDPTKRIEEPEPTPARKESFEVELKAPDIHQAYVDRLNSTLKVLKRKPTALQRQDTWRSYLRCKQLIPYFSDVVSDETLALIWMSQFESPSNVGTRLRHLEVLAKDLLEKGHHLSPWQWLQYLGLLYDEGNVDKALSYWEALEQDGRYGSGSEEDEFWILGVKLLTAVGELQRAQDIGMILAGEKPRDPRVLIPLIAAWARKREDGKQAWTLYLQVKSMLGRDITMEDYDAISVSLLKAGRADMAVAVFKDMMLTGQYCGSDSSELWQSCLGLVDHLQASSINEADVNKVSLLALTILPRRFQNKFFYASWMKKLIGLGEIDSAASVVELMYERGIRPDPRHLNGVIGGWLRIGSIASRDKAERLGWAMIQERIDWVWSEGPPKDAEPTASKHCVHDPKRGKSIPRYTQRKVPRANIETFSILLLHYSRRSQHDMVDYLIDCLEHARIRPNTFFVNHLMYSELRKHNILAAWTMYKNMKSSVSPDLETYACLWDCAKLQYDRTRSLYEKEFPAARTVFREMMDWFSTLTPHRQNRVRTEFSAELYNQILRCFCLSLDLSGSLVALRSMNECFAFAPDADTSRILMFLVVRLAPLPADVPKNRRRRIQSTPRSKENLEHASRLLQMLRNRKLSSLAKLGLDIEDLDAEVERTFQVELACDFLRVVMLRQVEGSGTVEQKLRDTAREMGVGNIDLGEPLDENL